MIDERWIRSLHVQTMRHADLHEEHGDHVLFQASTIGALLEGAYDGDVSFAELAARGDVGVGTFNGLDGEMIALDGCFYRANVDGAISPVSPAELTPFAVIARFEPSIEIVLEEPLPHDELLAAIDARLPPGTPSAVRIDGSFASVHARSVPRQTPPYRPLAEVVADQREFELGPAEGTMVGFRFPDYAEGIEVSGYHLHFITADRSRGGHVLGSRTEAVRVLLDPARDLHVELPPRVELSDPQLASATHRKIELVERGR